MSYPTEKKTDKFLTRRLRNFLYVQYSHATILLMSKNDRWSLFQIVEYQKWAEQQVKNAERQLGTA